MEQSMLSCRNSAKQNKIHICLDRRAQENLERARGLYESLLGRPVSASVAVRRGLDLLASYLENLNGDDWIKDEKATLVNHIR